MKVIGKPYSGKPNVRFDEGELEIELLATTPALYSTVILTLSPSGMGMEVVTALIPRFGEKFCGLVE
jgi:hypothetical protein